ncbi:MAG: hypothetical protein MJ157_06055 [Clostridia bacterium]|nr:hypothetical protein [Clostridia bacterium]
MFHPTNTRIIFADSAADAQQQYEALQIPKKDPNAYLECFKATEVEDFDFSAEFNFVGEISVSPEIMAKINSDPDRAYVLYRMEDLTTNE